VVKQFEHLSDAQLEQYGTDSITSISDDARRIDAHLEDCADCRSRLLEHHRARFALQADISMKASPQAGCVSEDDLRKLAAGIIAPGVAVTMTQHVAQCQHCAPILRAFAEDFSDDLTLGEITAENEMLAQLKSSSAKWQKQMAGQAQRANRNTADSSRLNCKPVTPGFGGWSLRWILVPVAVAATALTAFGLWYANHDTPEKVEKLLAQAYTEQRTMEYRWPGAEWGPVRVTRGAGQSHLPRPAAQLEAERILAEHQGSSSSDPKWLTVKAEAELQKGELPAAISDLAAALSRDPGSIRIKLLLAIAYAQQGEISGDRASSEQSLVLLDDFQDSQYANAARFNRGLVLKQLNLQDKSREEFDSLVHEETQPSWRPEDRTRGAKAN
jgi:tetratricopeptide (TPR) repeat protein